MIGTHRLARFGDNQCAATILSCIRIFQQIRFYEGTRKLSFVVANMSLFKEISMNNKCVSIENSTNQTKTNSYKFISFKGYSPYLANERKCFRSNWWEIDVHLIWEVRSKKWTRETSVYKNICYVNILTNIRCTMLRQVVNFYIVNEIIQWTIKSNWINANLHIHSNKITTLDCHKRKSLYWYPKLWK